MQFQTSVSFPSISRFKKSRTTDWQALILSPRPRNIQGILQGPRKGAAELPTLAAFTETCQMLLPKVQRNSKITKREKAPVQFSLGGQCGNPETNQKVPVLLYNQLERTFLLELCAPLLACPTAIGRPHAPYPLLRK